VGNTTPVALISIDRKNGFAGTVNISLQGIPQGVAAMPTATFTIGFGATGSVAFAIADSASAGTSQITILATSGQLSPVQWASGKGQSFPNGEKFSCVLGKHLPASSSLDPYFSAQPGRSPNPPRA
jgi:hypothetical protein